MGRGRSILGGPTILLEIGHAHLPPPPKKRVYGPLGAPTSGTTAETAPNLKPPMSDGGGGGEIGIPPPPSISRTLQTSQRGII